MDIPEPFDRDLDTFLKGPRALRGLDIDLVFATHFDEFMKDNSSTILQYGWSQLPILATSEVDPEVYYKGCDIGVMAFSSSLHPIGCYLWTALVLDEHWQGRGVGRELVIHRCTLDQANPVWDLDIPAYSPAGLAAHTSAWRQVNGL